MIALLLMEDSVMVCLNPQRLYVFDIKNPKRPGLYDDDLIMRFTSQLTMHIEEFVSQKTGNTSVYRLPEEFRWPAMCKIVEAHLRKGCNASEVQYDEVNHCFILGSFADIPNARERVLAQPPLHDGVPMTAEL